MEKQNLTKYKELLPVKEVKPLDISHFPSRFHAVVFRLWETVRAERIAYALRISEREVLKCASDMGLPPQVFTPEWEDRGYLTTIRNAWHLLPYDQLLDILGWDEKKLAVVLKEDDFLFVKLGYFKPYCERVVPTELDSAGLERLKAIKESISKKSLDLFSGARPFDFFSDCESAEELFSNDTEDIRLVYSYCGLYATVLDNDIEISYPEVLLKKYRAAGINAIWLPGVLYQLVPFYFDERYSEGYEKRLERLNKLIDLAGKYSIKVYLYLNEPRCMPDSFFENHPELKGHKGNGGTCLCTSVPAVLEYLQYAVEHLCKSAPGIGGFFVISQSENMTHCKSKARKPSCDRCRDVPLKKLISDVVNTIARAVKVVNSAIKVIAWTWGWDVDMSIEEIKECLSLIDKSVIIQSNSEAMKEFSIGGVKGKIVDYSMSIPGPSDLANQIWRYAIELGHRVCAKVQINVTWECSTIPYLPVFDLIREHMANLKESGVSDLMLSWTLGGYPSINLKIASESLRDPSHENYMRILKDEFGDYADMVYRSAKKFSDAFRAFPFDIHVLYRGPQNAGPSNLLYLDKTEFESTMTCYAYDDLDHWRSIYPREVFISQLKAVSDGFYEGLLEIKDMPDCLYKKCAEAAFAIFDSSFDL